MSRAVSVLMAIRGDVLSKRSGAEHPVSTLCVSLEVSLQGQHLILAKLLMEEAPERSVSFFSASPLSDRSA